MPPLYAKAGGGATHHRRLQAPRLKRVPAGLQNSIVIDFGTATTFDIIKNGVYDGGVIAPGVALTIKNLNKFTALLPLINLNNKNSKI